MHYLIHIVSAHSRSQCSINICRNEYPWAELNVCMNRSFYCWYPRRSKVIVAKEKGASSTDSLSFFFFFGLENFDCCIKTVTMADAIRS